MKGVDKFYVLWPILLPFRMYSIWPFGTFYGHFGIAFSFWYVVRRKIWQPCSVQNK
jgi:hypothetical protein